MRRQTQKRTIYLNLLFVGQSYSGIVTFSLGLLKYLIPLIEDDYEVNIICKKSSLIDQKYPINGQYIHCLDSLSNREGRANSIIQALLNFFFVPLVAKGAPIISFSNHAPILVPKQIVWIHDLMSVKYPSFNRFQNLYYKFSIPFFRFFSTKIACVSENTRQDLIKFFPMLNPDNICTLYEGFQDDLYNRDTAVNVAREFVAKTYNIDTSYFLVVGANASYKNIEVVLAVHESWAPYFKLIIVSAKGKYGEKLKELVSQFKLTDRVLFLDKVPPNAMVCLYRAAHCLIYPSLYEGFGLPPIEAMACNTPVICSQTSSLIEVCGDAAIFFNPTSKSSLKDAIEKSKDEKFIDSVRQKGVANASRFRWRDIAYELKSLILELTD